MTKRMRRKVATGVTTLLSTMMLMTPVMAASTANATSASSSSSPTTTSTTATGSSSDSNELTKNFSLPQASKLVKSKFANRGATVVFDMFFQIGNGQKANSLKLVDPLNSNLQFLKTKVYYNKTDSDGKAKTVDVTDEGKVDFDSKTNTTKWTANEPANWFGQRLDMRVKVKVNKQVDLTKVPNQGYMTINDQQVKTDTVNVNTLKAANPKPIVKTPTPTITKPAKKGILPQTGQMLKEHLWLVVAVGMAIVGLAGTYLFRKNTKKGGK